MFIAGRAGYYLCSLNCPFIKLWCFTKERRYIGSHLKYQRQDRVCLVYSRTFKINLFTLLSLNTDLTFFVSQSWQLRIAKNLKCIGSIWHQHVFLWWKKTSQLQVFQQSTANKKFTKGKKIVLRETVEFGNEWTLTLSLTKHSEAWNTFKEIYVTSLC